MEVVRIVRKGVLSKLGEEPKPFYNQVGIKFKVYKDNN